MKRTCWVACGVPQCPGDGVSGEAQDADGEVAQAGHDMGSVAGAYLGEVFSEGDVADPVQLVLDLPVPADPAGELGGLSLPGWQRRDSVRGLGVPVAGGQATGSAGDLDRLLAWGKASPAVTVTTLRMRFSARP